MVLYAENDDLKPEKAMEQSLLRSVFPFMENVNAFSSRHLQEISGPSSVHEENNLSVLHRDAAGPSRSTTITPLMISPNGFGIFSVDREKNEAS